MKREEVIEIASASFMDMHSADSYCRESYWTAIQDELEAFANEVERRTIEKCAQSVEGEHVWITSVAASRLIRALANQQEKQ